jgi:hypothetical protein
MKGVPDKKNLVLLLVFLLFVSPKISAKTCVEYVEESVLALVEDTSFLGRSANFLAGRFPGAGRLADFLNSRATQRYLSEAVPTIPTLIEGGSYQPAEGELGASVKMDTKVMKGYDHRLWGRFHEGPFTRGPEYHPVYFKYRRLFTVGIRALHLNVIATGDVSNYSIPRGYHHQEAPLKVIEILQSFRLEFSFSTERGEVITPAVMEQLQSRVDLARNMARYFLRDSIRESFDQPRWFDYHIDSPIKAQGSEETKKIPIRNERRVRTPEGVVFRDGELFLGILMDVLDVPQDTYLTLARNFPKLIRGEEDGSGIYDGYYLVAE